MWSRLVFPPWEKGQYACGGTDPAEHLGGDAKGIGKAFPLVARGAGARAQVEGWSLRGRGGRRTGRRPPERQLLKQAAPNRALKGSAGRSPHSWASAVTQTARAGPGVAKALRIPSATLCSGSHGSFRARPSSSSGEQGASELHPAGSWARSGGSAQTGAPRPAPGQRGPRHPSAPGSSTRETRAHDPGERGSGGAPALRSSVTPRRSLGFGRGERAGLCSQGCAQGGDPLGPSHCPAPRGRSPPCGYGPGRRAVAQAASASRLSMVLGPSAARFCVLRSSGGRKEPRGWRSKRGQALGLLRMVVWGPPTRP